MSLLKYLCFRKVLLFLYFFLFLFSSSSFFASSETSVHDELQQTRPLDPHFRVRRLLVKDLDSGGDDDETNLPPPPKKKKLTGSVSSSSSTTSGTKKNQTKLIKPISSSSSTKLIKPISSSSTKNQTKPAKTSSMGTSQKLNSTKSSSNTTKAGSELKKLNSGTKPTNSTKPVTNSIKKSADLSKSSSSKNKTTTKPPSSKLSSPTSEKKSPSSKKPVTKSKPIEKEIKPFWLDDEEDEDFVSEFRDLPTKFQRSLIPDLERFSTTSKNYINKANKEITRNFKPYFGNKYAPTIASVVSFVFILVPLLLVSLIFNRFKAYFSLQKILIFIQIYLSIYFSILCISSLVTGIEPLKFLYATSSSTYVCLQILQTLGYVFYLLLLLMYLVLVFSTDCGLGLKVLGLAQTFVGFAVGLHYYVAVFHRVVLRQPPRTNWKIHGVYATCFLMICLLSSAERRKKEYLEEGGDEGKKN
ncbi:PREDICTED: cell wall integrity and stress response component 3-like [Camelina sativa]|uniref:Cell wall integrity and stress response component 3-like n=1 Tax=Camelina sativa TaxID=90675 RepID=A0ABM0TV66_CAMSA|nr:PREDICTED: cell wall integrity and stress response component 3-like [Camelina sativa]